MFLIVLSVSTLFSASLAQERADRPQETAATLQHSVQQAAHCDGRVKSERALPFQDFLKLSQKGAHEDNGTPLRVLPRPVPVSASAPASNPEV